MIRWLLNGGNVKINIFPVTRQSITGVDTFGAIQNIEEIANKFKTAIEVNVPKEQVQVHGTIVLTSVRHDGNKEWLDIARHLKNISVNQTNYFVFDNPLVLWKGGLTDKLNLLQLMMDGYGIRFYTRLWTGSDTNSKNLKLSLSNKELQYTMVTRVQILPYMVTWDLLKRSYVGRLANAAKGHTNNRTILDDTINAIRETAKKAKENGETVSLRVLAKRFNISHSSVSNILKGGEG